MILPKHYENLQVLHENAMPPRAYYIPASHRLVDPVEHREKSDRMQLLSGNWKFKYYPCLLDLKDEFYQNGYDSASFDTIAVPGTWQTSGYDQHQYTNIRYPFPFDPPYVPLENPCGAYLCYFEHHKNPSAPKVFLNFEGVDSCYYVWLNGSYVGYSQVSHATAEFDITDLLRNGRNTLAVLVLKWCDGSYLEDQDKFRMSGIFRDVYILSRPIKSIWDYHVTTRISANKALVSVNLEFTDAVDTSLSIEDASGSVIASATFSNSGTVLLEIPNPILWNTESPYLYSLVIETANEVITDQLALRTVEICDKAICFNKQRIKFRGVNYHDSDPVTGFFISVDQYKKDLTLMKQHNFNAIRTSHYPKPPFFYLLCERYGFMVIDEADLEAHGPFLLYRREDTEQNRFNRWNEALADNPAWEYAIVDRMQQMVQRNKNRFCIVIWSAGNESAYGCNLEKALQWVKEFDTDRLTQYESARYRNPLKHYDYSNLDLYSRMYPSLSEIQDYLCKDASKPFLLVEYCHSMGNGPGDFEDYFQMIHRNDLMCGGFVWEWCDHAVYHGRAANGKDIYYYGGDHGELIHDGNFCVDGLVYPDRTPHTGLLEYKNVYRPARVVSYNIHSGELILHNYLDFDNLSDYASLSYELSCDGAVIKSGDLPSISVEPHENGKMFLPLDVSDAGRIYLKFIYRLKRKMPLLPLGYELGFDEMLLSNPDCIHSHAAELLQQHTTGLDTYVSEESSELIIKGKDFTYTLNKQSGLFSSMNYGTHALLLRPMETNIWRAPTDNDMYIKNEWEKAHYHQAYTRAYYIKTSQDIYGVHVFAHVAVVAPTVQKLLDAEITWNIDDSGKITARLKVKKDQELPPLPRFGIRFFLNKAMNQISYYGMGPMESYVDKHRGAFHGTFSCSVSNQHEDYLRPQENGSHYDCDFAEVSGLTFGIAFASQRPFSFNASTYTQETLEHCAHNYELHEADGTILCLDYAQNGIGSNSCGPEVLAQYQFKETDFEFRFCIVPFIKKQ